MRQAKTEDCNQELELISMHSAILVRELDMNPYSAKPNVRRGAYAPELTLIEGTSLLHQPMACSEG